MLVSNSAKTSLIMADVTNGRVLEGTSQKQTPDLSRGLSGARKAPAKKSPHLKGSRPRPGVRSNRTVNGAVNGNETAVSAAPPYQFKVGEHAVYKGHGVGVVSAVETQEYLGQRYEFYVFHLEEKGLRKIMIPKNNAESMGLRPIISKDDADRVVEILKSRDVRVDAQTWIRRYREYIDKINTGSIFEIAEVLRDLFLLKVDKELSFSERRLLETARKLLVKELSLATNRDDGTWDEQVLQICGL